MTLVDPADFYKGFRVSYNEKHLEIFVQPPHNNTTFIAELEQVFKPFDRVNVCLSGGIDSQFALSMLNTIGKDIHVYIFSFIWEDTVFNSPDVLHAMRYCERYNYKYTNIEIDYKHFLHTGQHLKTCKAYKATSPQVALQLKMVDYIEDKTIPVVLGGDPPLLGFDKDSKEAKVIGIEHHVFTTNAFLNYSVANNRIVIKDLFKITPITYYLGLKQTVDSTIKHKLVVPSDLNASGGTQLLRKLIYTDMGAQIMPPLLKNTGFEILKMHLAIGSGVYNQFDVLYRFPLENTLKQEEWYNHKVYTVKLKRSSTNELTNLYEEFCREATDLKFCKVYNFIL